MTKVITIEPFKNNEDLLAQFLSLSLETRPQDVRQVRLLVPAGIDGHQFKKIAKYLNMLINPQGVNTTLYLLRRIQGENHEQAIESCTKN